MAPVASNAPACWSTWMPAPLPLHVAPPSPEYITKLLEATALPPKNTLDAFTGLTAITWSYQHCGVQKSAKPFVPTVNLVQVRPPSVVLYPPERLLPPLAASELVTYAVF